MSIQRRSTREYIRQTLMERILDGTYKAGDRLVELQIAVELNTSQGPVREALRDLEGLGVVESEPYKGTRVRALSDREVDEASQVRAALEELAAQLAAPNLKNKVEALEKEADAFVQAAKERDLKAYSEHDIAFHRIIVEASGNQMLAGIWNSVVLEARFQVTVVRVGEDELENFASAHLPILESLRSGDGKLAGKLVKKLICTFHSRRVDGQSKIPSSQNKQMLK